MLIPMYCSDAICAWNTRISIQLATNIHTYIQAQSGEGKRSWKAYEPHLRIVIPPTATGFTKNKKRKCRFSAEYYSWHGGLEGFLLDCLWKMKQRKDIVLGNRKPAAAIPMHILRYVNSISFFL